MSITISSQLFGKFECRMDDLRCAIADGEMDDAQKMMERMVKAFAEIRGTATTGPAAASEEVTKVKVKKSRKTKTDADGEPKPKRAPTEWSLHCTNVLFPLIIPAIKEAKAAESAKSGEKREFKKFGFHLNVAGYLKNSGKMNPTAEEVKAAIEFLLDHPDHKSQTEISRSAGNSTVEKPKARGRPKKAAAPAPEPLKSSEVIAKLEAALSEADEEESDDDDEDEDEDEEVPLTGFEYKGNHYLKDPFQEVYTAEGKMEWLGTFNGKKIIKGEMPARVKKFIESQD
jgi:hypothetical protein